MILMFCINRNFDNTMKHISLLLGALALLSVAAPVRSEAGYPTQFRGVCQSCGHDLIAQYRPVECIDGGFQRQWVRVPHHHCRPAYLGKKYDFFNSHLMNPANPKQEKRQNCPPCSQRR